MNWGIRITFAYLAFVALILSLVIGSVQQDFHLVTKDYYAQELAYESRINELQNTHGLEVQPIIQKQPGELTIHLPSTLTDIKGTIHLYRPSDARLDRKWDIALSPSGQQSLPTAGLRKGLWKVQLEWEATGKTYYFEKSLIL